VNPVQRAGRLRARPLAQQRRFFYKPRSPTDGGPRRTIMAVPKRKKSPSKRGMRRSADAPKRPTYFEDKDSRELRPPHHLDLKTGMYRGRQVLSKKSES